jgi:small conductance mechanosensitive channel
VLGCYIVAFVLERTLGENSAFRNLISTHVFNRNGDGNTLIRTALTILVGFLIINSIRFVIKIFGNAENKRRQTIVVLLANLSKYIGYTVVLGILLSVWGVSDAIIAVVFAALGIAVGFGAQGLIGDLIAGLFLIFENAIQVGDYVTFDNFRGEVVEVGIRTTRLKNIVGDVKIINNSELRAFVNMSMHRSVAICDITIEYGENIEKVEGIIKTDGPWYKGVSEFTSRGVMLKITAKCDEKDRYQTDRDLNREFKLLFDKNKIKIALPVVEVVENKTKG